jgi:cobalt/nickel transport protein
MPRIARPVWMLMIVVALAVVPMFIGGEFKGADNQAAAAIEATQPGFTPWAVPLWKPPSPEIESLLFALQAALGALVIGYIIGRRHGRDRAE